MAKGKYITEKQFTLIKRLLKAGNTQKDVAECSELSINTVQRINVCENYEDYKNFSKQNHVKQREQDVQTVEHRQTVTIQATHYMMTELQKTNELLKGISAKLAFIVDELCGTGQKKEE